MSKVSWHEEPIILDCEGYCFVGIVTQPAESSENDLTVQEFISLYDWDKMRKKTLRHKDVCQHFVEGANYTFSSQDWRNQASRLTMQ